MLRGCPRILKIDGRLFARLTIVSLLLILVTVLYYVVVDASGLLSGLFFFELKHRIHGMFYLLAIACASTFFQWRGYATVWLLAFLLHLPRTIFFSLSEEALVGNLGFWLVPLLAGGIVALERQWRARQKANFAERQRERELLLRRILVAQEDERRRIAKELHDETLQDLIALAYAAEATLGEIPESANQPRLRIIWIKDQCVRISRELRRISYDLRPSMLDQLGLVPAVRWLAERISTESKVTTEVGIHGKVERLDRQTESEIFRIVQEALTNVRKHSGATRATVTLTFSRESLEVAVMDNGRGFETGRSMRRLASTGHLGIIGMRERATAIGAHLVLRSDESSGTLLSMRVPRLAKAAQAKATKEAS